MPEVEGSNAATPMYGISAPMWRAVDFIIGGVASALLMFMMLVTFVDVVGRYFFNAPLPGGYELTELLMFSMAAAGIPTVTRRGEHITVNLFDWAFSGKVRIARDCIIALIVAICAGYLTWRLYLWGERFFLFGDATGTLHIPLAPIAYAGAFAMAVACLASLFRVAEVFVSPVQSSEGAPK